MCLVIADSELYGLRKFPKSNRIQLMSRPCSFFMFCMCSAKKEEATRQRMNNGANQGEGA